MAKRLIVQVPDPILAKKCREVDKFDERLWTLLDDMKDTLFDANGAGLAAPQVGENLRVFVIDVDEYSCEAKRIVLSSRAFFACEYNLPSDTADITKKIAAYVKQLSYPQGTYLRLKILLLLQRCLRLRWKPDAELHQHLRYT